MREFGWKSALSKGAVCALSAATLGAPLKARAHHSFAAFDMAREIKLNGVVETFDWTNPHVGIRFLVIDESGKQKRWRIEAAAPGMLTRTGWTGATLKPGQQVTLSVHPLKTGEAAAGLVSVSFPDGRTLGGGGITPSLPIK